MNGARPSRQFARMSKKNGKLAVVAILAAVLLLSLLALLVQKRINANIGRPAPAEQPAPEPARAEP